MAISVNEPIRVGAVFDHGVTPVWFLWQGRRYHVKTVTMRWQTTEGRATLLHLSVTDHANLFELVLNQQTLSWAVAAVEPGGCE